MGIDAIGSTGNERALVAVVINGQGGNVLRIHDEYLIHLIGENLMQDTDQELIPFHDLIQIGEELGAWETSVAGENGMRPLSSHGKAGPVQMADGDLEDALIGAVVNRERAFDCRNIHVTHNAGPGYIQGIAVFFLFLVREGKNTRAKADPAVKSPRSFQNRVIFRGIHRRYRIRVGGNGPGLVERVPIVTEAGIQQQGQACDKDDDKKNTC